MEEYRIFDSFQDVVLVLNEDGGVVYGNQAASTLFEVSARRLSAKKPLSHFASFKPCLFAPGELGLINEATQVKEIAFTLTSGKAGWVQVSLQKQRGLSVPAPEERRDGVSDPAERWLIYMRDVSLEKTLHDKYRAELDQKELVIADLRKARVELEDYSRNLEKMVEVRTAELHSANVLLKTILDSLGQGILVFDADGKCLPIFSKVCLSFFGREPSGESIESMLKLRDHDVQAFGQWRQAAFGEVLDFDDLALLAPNTLVDWRREKVGGALHGPSLDEGVPTREIFLGYNPMRDDNGKIRGVVLVATDRTREMQALREVAHEREIVRRVVRVGRNRDAFLRFVRDARGLVNGLESWRWLGVTSTLPAIDQREEMLRHLHTLKGGAASFAFAALASGAHQLEEKLKDAPVETWGALAPAIHSAASQMRVGLETDLASLAELLGPLDDAEQDGLEIPLEYFKEWSAQFTAATTLERAQELCRELTRRCFEKPLGPQVEIFNAGLLELASELGKEFRGLVIEGGTLRVFERPLRPLMKTLVHAFRNALDHGLETAKERMDVGKEPAGKISVRFEKAPGAGLTERLLIEISDDGRGVDIPKVRRKLLELGLQRDAEMADDDICQMILHPELSTADQVTEISGRGVGMSAIAAEVRALGGTIWMTSKMGEGSTLRMEIPLPAINEALVGDGLAAALGIPDRSHAA